MIGEMVVTAYYWSHPLFADTKDHELDTVDLQPWKADSIIQKRGYCEYTYKETKI